MTAKFSITPLLGQRALIQGTDTAGVTGKVTVSTQQWDELNARKGFEEAQAGFDEAVAKFFAPITEAAEAANQKVEVPVDEMSYVVLNEGVEAVAGQPDEIVKLWSDSILIRLVEAKQFKRLVWVGDVLEVTAG